MEPIGHDPELVDRLLMLVPPQEGWTYGGTVVCTLWQSPQRVKVTVITQGFNPEDWGITGSEGPEIMYSSWVVSILKMAEGNFDDEDPF